MSAHLIAPHGGALVDLFAVPDRATEIAAASRDWPSHDLTPQQLCDLEASLGLAARDGGAVRARGESAPVAAKSST